MEATAQIQVQSPVSDYLVETHLNRNDDAVAALVNEGVSVLDAASAVVEARVAPALEGPMRSMLRVVRATSTSAAPTRELIGEVPDEEWPRLAATAEWCQLFVSAFYLERTAKEAAAARLLPRVRASSPTSATANKKKRAARPADDEEAVAAKKQKQEAERAARTSALAEEEDNAVVVVEEDNAASTKKMPLKYDMFLRLNVRGKLGSISRDQYVGHRLRTRKEFETLCKTKFPEIADMKNPIERGIELSRLWKERCSRKMDWCIGFGRVPEYAKFISVNKEVLRESKLRQGQVWADYNAAWDALVGTVLLKTRPPQRKAEGPAPVVVAPPPVKKAVVVVAAAAESSSSSSSSNEDAGGAGAVEEIDDDSE